MLNQNINCETSLKAKMKKNNNKLLSYRYRGDAFTLLGSSHHTFFFKQEIRNQASEYPYRVAKLPANRNLNRYRDVSPCESIDKELYFNEYLELLITMCLS